MIIFCIASSETCLKAIKLGGSGGTEFQKESVFENVSQILEILTEDKAERGFGVLV